MSGIVLAFVGVSGGAPVFIFDGTVSNAPMMAVGFAG